MTIEAVKEAVSKPRAVRRPPETASQPLDPLEALAQWMVTDQQVDAMEATRMIWRHVLALSHLVVWSAPANGGKTTIATFAAAELASQFTVLFFQEDASAGDLPALHKHAKDHGYRMLNSTLAGSSPDEQLKALRDLTKGAADLTGFVMIFDTLKKYLDLMNKGGARAFFQLMRALTQRGATVLLLGHTNKHKGIDGKLMFEGVGDVRNDVDELIYIEATEKDAAGMVTMTMRPDKVRCAVRETSFLLNTATREVRVLDRVIDVAAQLEQQRRRQLDADVIDAIVNTLRQGGMARTELIERAAGLAGESRRAVGAVVDRYCGDSASDRAALWMETRLKVNNTRYVSLKPEGTQ